MSFYKSDNRLGCLDCGQSYACADNCPKPNFIKVNKVQLAFRYYSILKEKVGILKCYPGYDERAIAKIEGARKSTVCDTVIYTDEDWYRVPLDKIPHLFLRTKPSEIVDIPKMKLSIINGEFRFGEMDGWFSMTCGFDEKTRSTSVNCPQCSKLDLYPRLVYPKQIDETGLITDGEYFCSQCGFGGRLRLKGYYDNWSVKDNPFYK